MNKKKKMDIIYEDKEFLVINKPSGLLTIATEKEKIKTLYHEARTYIKKQNPKNKIFIVHRLDKETSGIVVFAKNEKLKNKLQEHWNDYVKNREYLAIVEGKITKKKETLTYYLKESKTHQVFISDEKNGKKAITHLRLLANNKAYSLLKINLETGRKNQIRVSLNEYGYPIIGDKKYNSTKNPIGRLGLHATVLELEINQKKHKWCAKVPENFKAMFENAIENYETK
ncbi:MAG: RNA pseudouridine synthase [Bacilli bacterium]|jgi:RluA family pseudouridine synthase|nr:RNA pseudouridine synthase [Bacilli bacterium]